MTPSRAKQFAWLTSIGAAGAIAWAGWYALAPLPEGDEFASAIGADSVNDTERDAIRTSLAVPAEVLAATLRDDLFPDPPPAPREAPLPRLELELIAIYREGAARSAFVFAPAQDEYRELVPGDEAPGGAVLASLEPSAAVFDLAGREVRLELRP